MKLVASVIGLSFFINIGAFAQRETKSPLWGKLSLAQNHPNPVYEGETAVIDYKAPDVKDVSIALYNSDGKHIFTYEDLYPGTGQISIRIPLKPGAYTYALLVQGRMVEKRKMEINAAPLNGG